MPVPESATVLFVTDRYDGGLEVSSIARAVEEGGRLIKALPYVLCLVTNRPRTMEFEGGDEMLLPQICNVPVISLYQQETP
jgi:hypothetical protein